MTDDEFRTLWVSASEEVADKFYPKGQYGHRSEYLRDQATLYTLIAERVAAADPPPTMPFERLMKIVAIFAGHLAAGELAERVREPAWRVRDAIDAVRVLRGESTYIDLGDNWRSG